MRCVAKGFAEGLLFGGAVWLLAYVAGWKHGRRDLRQQSIEDRLGSEREGGPRHWIPEHDQPGWWLALKRWLLQVDFPGARARWGGKQC